MTCSYRVHLPEPVNYTDTLYLSKPANHNRHAFIDWVPIACKSQQTYSYILNLPEPINYNRYTDCAYQSLQIKKSCSYRLALIACKANHNRHASTDWLP